MEIQFEFPMNEIKGKTNKIQIQMNSQIVNDSN